jgi:exodeoxyribonuclease VII large subunit
MRLKSAALNLKNKETARLGLLNESARLLDPANTLKRGYSITYLDNKPLRDSRDVLPGMELKTELFSGKINSIVKSKEDTDE